MLTTCINNKSVHSVWPGYAEQGLQEKFCKARNKTALGPGGQAETSLTIADLS